VRNMRSVLLGVGVSLVYSPHARVLPLIELFL